MPDQSVLSLSWQQGDTDLQEIARSLNRLGIALGVGLTYTTGTWVPLLQFGGATTGVTYGTQLGSWTQIGREIVCRFSVVLTSKGSATGAATLAGLPFLAHADATNNGAGGLILSYANMSGLSAAPLINVGSGASAVSLVTAGASATTALADTAFTNTSTLNGSFTYFM